MYPRDLFVVDRAVVIRLVVRPGPTLPIPTPQSQARAFDCGTVVGSS